MSTVIDNVFYALKVTGRGQNSRRYPDQPRTTERITVRINQLDLITPDIPRPPPDALLDIQPTVAEERFAE